MLKCNSIVNTYLLTVFTCCKMGKYVEKIKCPLKKKKKKRRDVDSHGVWNLGLWSWIDLNKISLESLS